MKHEIIAARLQELGHSTRLNIFRRLIKAAPHGLSVGDLQRKLDVPASTLSHHLTRLRTVGLITQHRSGAQLTCQPQIKALIEVIDYLQEECCGGDSCRDI